MLGQIVFFQKTTAKASPHLATSRHDSTKAGTTAFAFYDGLWVPLLRDGERASEVGVWGTTGWWREKCEE